MQCIPCGQYILADRFSRNSGYLVELEILSTLGCQFPSKRSFEKSKNTKVCLNLTLKFDFKFHLPGYDIYKNDRLVGTKGGVAILVKKGIIANQEWKNEHFNVITDSEAIAIEIELQNGDKVIFATIYCPNGNPSLRLFRMINALSKQVIFLGDFNSKHKQFGCVKPNKSGQTLVNIAKDLKLFYVNQLEPNSHTREDPVHPIF